MKRVLFLSSGRPEPGHGGGERSLSILRALERIARTDVLVVPPLGVSFEPRAGEHAACMPGPRDENDAWFWRRRNWLLKDFRSDPAVADAVARLHREHRYDAFLGRYQLPVLGACADHGPTFIDLDDLPTDATRTRIPLLRAVRRMATNRCLRPMAGVFVAKRRDAAEVRHPRVDVLPCISTQPPAAGVPADESAAPRLLFVGGLYWPPNREGVVRFAERSLPRIRESVPAATLRLVGSRGELAAGLPGVDAAGFVPDIAAEYRRAAVTVCPVRSGAGAVVKLAEAAGFGQAIVATPYSARGYDGILEPGRDLLVAESDEDFADRCIEVLTNPERRATLRRAALQAARTGLSQAAVDAVVERTVGAVL